MVQSLTFIDCSTCGKRIRSNAAKCHHCHQLNVPSDSISNLSDSGSWGNPKTRDKNGERTGSPTADRHLASNSDGSSSGGPDGSGEYGEDADDFDYDEYLAEEFPSHARQNPKPRGKRWVWVTAWVLIFATLLPYLYWAVILAK